MVSLWAVFAVLAAAYVALLVYAGRSGNPRFQPIGPLLMVRTQWGKKTIDRLSRGRHWGWIADAFIVMTVAAGLLMVVLLVWQNTLLFTHTDAVRERPPRLQDALAIPGINPFIPIGYGLFALVVALVIHEGGHGVLARFAKLPVKSLGLVLLVIPVGAFVEPDETALQRTSLRNKMRLFAAGPGPNLVLAAICVMLFAQVMAPAIEPAHEGVAVMGVVEGLPAQQGGLEAGMFITALDGTAIRTQEEFTGTLNESRSKEPIEVSYWFQGTAGTLTVLPLDRYEYFQENAPAANREWYRGKPYLGVVAFGPDQLSAEIDRLESPFDELGVGQGSLFYVAMPFIGLQPAPQTYHDVYDPAGGPWDDNEGAFWITFNSLYWLFWINFLLGTFNALPLGPLDGGQMFRHSIHWFYRRRQGIRTDDLEVVQPEAGSQPVYIARDPAIAERLEVVEGKVRTANRVLGYSLLALLAVPFIVPQFL